MYIAINMYNINSFRKGTSRINVREKKEIYNVRATHTARKLMSRTIKFVAFS